MNKTFLIFRHEFLHMVKKIGFIIMTLIVPIGVLVAIGVFQFISVGERPPEIEIKTIGYVDEAGGFDRYVVQDSIEMVRFDSQDDATAALVGNEISEYFVIPGDYLATGVIKRYTLEKEVDTPPAVSSAIRNFLTVNMLAGKVSEDTISRIESPVHLAVTRLTETGDVATEQGGFGNIIIPGIFSLLLALSLMVSSTYMIQGLGEEKESRLIEVLLSSVSTRQLLIGKVLGLGIAGLLQVVIWLISAPLLLSLASSSFGGLINTIQIPANFIILGIVYFILGYLLFAVLAAGVAAISPNAREGQQVAMIYVMLVFVPLWFSSLLFIYPNSPVWIVLSIFPITAPIETMLRLGVSDVATWEIAVSLAVMILSIIGVLFFAIRVFRMYLLMYGKRPGLREIVRNLKSG
ncbi:MAG: ABC transporter permease [Dehalococcoidia bacterium]